jgi:hypothetical protein
MPERSQRNTVPQIFLDDLHGGGYTDLVALQIEAITRQAVIQDAPCLPPLHGGKPYPIGQVAPAS